MIVTFSRTGLAPSPLVVTVDSAGLYLPEDAVGVVGRRIRRTYGPESAYVRAPLLAIVEDAASVALTIYARGNSAAHLQELREQLEAATAQFRYTLTVDRVGVVSTYPAESELPTWDLQSDAGAVAEHLDRARIVVPVNP